MVVDILCSIFAIFLIFTDISDAGKPLASYIKPCSKSAADFDDCCLAHGREALPSMLKGDPEYKVPSLMPLNLQLITLNTNDLKFLIKNVQLHGIDSIDLKQVKFDLINKKVSAKFLFTKIDLIGECHLDGKFLMVPVNGIGNCDFTFDGTDVAYHIDYRLDIRDGEEYFTIDSASCDFIFQKININIENIFADNKELSASTNKALNDNWKAALVIVEPMVRETIISMGYTIISGFAGAVPFKNIFLD